MKWVLIREALIEPGVQARDKVGFIADHRLEWTIVDAGVLMTGAANVPRGTGRNRVRIRVYFKSLRS